METITQKHVDAYLSGKAELKDLLGFSPEYVKKLKGRTQFFLDGGHKERALMMLEMLEELDRKDTLPTLLAIDILLQLGKSDAAEEKVNTLLTRRPDDPDALVALAELKLAIGELVPAAKALKKVVDKDPKGTTAAGKRARAVAARAHARLMS